MTNQTVVFNTPKNLDINDLFQKLKDSTKYKITAVNRHHLIFTIHQINYFTKKYGHCDLDAQAYYETFGSTPNVVSAITALLCELDIIRQSRRGNNENGKVSSYVFIDPYHWNDSNESIPHIYNTTDNIPHFIHVCVANSFKMKRKEDWITIVPKSKKQRKPKAKTLSKPELVDRVKQLEALLAENGIAIPDKKDLFNKQSKGQHPFQKKIETNNTITAPLSDATPITDLEPVQPYPKPVVVTKTLENNINMNKYNKQNDTYIINADTNPITIKEASILINYFQQSEVNTSDFVKKVITLSDFRNNVYIRDIKNKKMITGSKELINGEMYFTIKNIA